MEHSDKTLLSEQIENDRNLIAHVEMPSNS